MAAPINELILGVEDTEMARRTKALLVLAACAGNAFRAADLLRETDLDVSYTTLKRWRNRHPDVYDNAVDQVAEMIEQRTANVHRELALRALELTGKALERFEHKVHELGAAEAAKAARDLSHVAGQSTRDMLTLTGRPTEITEQRSVAEIGASLAERFPGVVVIEHQGDVEEEDSEDAA